MKLSRGLGKEKTNVGVKTSTTFNAPGNYVAPYGKTVVRVGGRGASGANPTYASTNPVVPGNTNTYSYGGGTPLGSNPVVPGNTNTYSYGGGTPLGSNPVVYGNENTYGYSGGTPLGSNPIVPGTQNTYGYGGGTPLGSNPIVYGNENTYAVGGGNYSTMNVGSYTPSYDNYNPVVPGTVVGTRYIWFGYNPRNGPPAAFEDNYISYDEFPGISSSGYPPTNSTGANGTTHTEYDQYFNPSSGGNYATTNADVYTPGNYVYNPITGGNPTGVYNPNSGGNATFNPITGGNPTGNYNPNSGGNPTYNPITGGNPTGVYNPNSGGNPTYNPITGGNYANTNPNSGGNPTYNPITGGNYASTNPATGGNDNYTVGAAGGSSNIQGVTFPGGASAALAPVVAQTTTNVSYTEAGISITVPTGGYVTIDNI
jgi:hypothetical protein